MPHRKIESMVVLCPLEHDKDEFEGERMIGLLFTFFLGHSVYEAHWHRGGGDDDDDTSHRGSRNNKNKL